MQKHSQIIHRHGLLTHVNQINVKRSKEGEKIIIYKLLNQ